MEICRYSTNIIIFIGSQDRDITGIDATFIPKNTTNRLPIADLARRELKRTATPMPQHLSATG